MKQTKVETAREGDLGIIQFAVAQMAAIELFERVEDTLVESFKEKLEKDLEANLKEGNRKQRKEAEMAMDTHIQRCKSSFKSFKKNNKVLVESISTFANAEDLKRIVTEVVKDFDEGIIEG